MTSPGAQVSGPGALSQRTDVGGQPIRHMADPRYGEDKAFVEQQKGAPLADGPDAPPAPSMGGMGQASSSPEQPAMPRDVTPFGAPTERPDEPVTAGSPLGPGPGPNIGKPPVGPGQLSSALSQYFAADNTGILQDFAWQLSEMGI